MKTNSRKYRIILMTCLVSLFSTCTTPEKKQAREEQLCFLKVTQGEMIMTADGNMEMLIDSLVMSLHIKNDSVMGAINWLPSQKDKMTGTLEGTIQDDVITAIYSYTAEGIATKEEKILKLDSNKLSFKTGELELHNGVWALRDKNAVFSESIPKTPCR